MHLTKSPTSVHVRCTVIYAYHLHYVHGQWAVGWAVAVLLKVDRPHPFEAASNFPLEIEVHVKIWVYSVQGADFEVNLQFTVFEGRVELLHHVGTVSMNAHTGSSGPEEVEVYVLLGGLSEAQAKDLIEPGDSGNMVTIILGQVCVHLRRREGLDTMGNVPIIIFTDVLLRES